MLPSHLSNAAAPVTIGGREYLITALSDRDFDELSLWRQARVLRIARASLDPEASEAERRATLKAAFEYAGEIDFLSEAMSGDPIAQKEALAQFVWRLLRGRQEMSLEDTTALVEKHIADMAAVIDAWHLLTFDEPPEATAKKNDPR